jgi:phosphate transport system substrate-binding protein
MLRSTAIALALLSMLPGCKEKQKIRVSGSETMHTMMRILAENFNKRSSDYQVSVEGGGSVRGIADLANGVVEIIASSREILPHELQAIEMKGQAEQIVVAYDGTAVVVHPSNKLESIHLSQVSDIFSGRVKNWKDVGGENKPITVVIRSDQSGTAFFFREHVLRQLDLGAAAFKLNKDRDYVPGAVVVNDNIEMSQAIDRDPGAIGFMGMGSAEVDAGGRVKRLKYAVRPEETAVVASIENVYNRKYKLGRPLYILYHTGNAGVDEFVSFATGEEGQKTIAKSGYLRSSMPAVEVRERK